MQQDFDIDFVGSHAGVVELVDTPDLGSGAVRCESSSLSSRTILYRSVVSVAQLVELRIVIPAVAGSNPVVHPIL